MSDLDQYSERTAGHYDAPVDYVRPAVPLRASNEPQDRRFDKWPALVVILVLVGVGLLVTALWWIASAIFDALGGG